MWNFKGPQSQLRRWGMFARVEFSPGVGSTDDVVISGSEACFVAGAFQKIFVFFFALCLLLHNSRARAPRTRWVHVARVVSLIVLASCFWPWVETAGNVCLPV